MLAGKIREIKEAIAGERVKFTKDLEKLLDKQREAMLQAVQSRTIEITGTARAVPRKNALAASAGTLLF